MIKEEDLQEAIAECQGVKSPNANTCLKLASYYTIMDHLDEKDRSTSDTSNTYSYANAANISYSGRTQFAHMINGLPADDVWPLMDELMSTLEIANPRLYDSVMRELKKKERGF